VQGTRFTPTFLAVLYSFNVARLGADKEVMLKVVVFWTQTSYGRVNSYRRFEGSCCPYLQGPHAILLLLGCNLNYFSFAYIRNNFLM